MRSFTVWPAIVLCMLLVGCTSGPTLYTAAQNTAVAHPENKVLFVDLLEKGEPSTNQSVDLQYGYELKYQKGNDASSLGEKIPSSDMVQKGDEFSIILNAVWIPELPRKGLLRGDRDIAVILDIVAEDGETKPIVVAYQRSVRGNHLLNFKNIVVYNTKDWDGVHQPYFHLRILDVTSERNKNTQELLDSAASSVNSLAGIVQSAYFPHIAQAIKTSKYILGGKKNQILLDYKIQFFNLSPVDGNANSTISVGQVLDRFAQGNWIALGRPKKTDPSFWNSEFTYDRKSAQVNRYGACNIGRSRMLRRKKAADQEECEETLDVPYVSMVVVKKDYGISKSILKTFNSLAQLILNGESQSTSGRFKEISEELDRIAKSNEEEEQREQQLVVAADPATKTNVRQETLKNFVQEYIDETDSYQKRRLGSFLVREYDVPIGLLIKDEGAKRAPNMEVIKSLFRED